MRTVIFTLLLCFTSNTVLHAQPEDTTPRADYVIVGVGTAGAVLAKILTDDKKTSVIAIHSGENLTQDPEIKFSKNALGVVLSALFGSSFYETGNTIPQAHVDFRELLWAIGLPEGGASSINAGLWARGTNQVYSQWEAIAGPEWSVERIQEIYNTLENYHGETSDTAVRGFHGPVDVRQVPVNKIGEKFNRACIEATGFPFVLDYNDPHTPIGCSNQVQNTQRGVDGRLRVSSATAFLNKRVMTPDGHGVNGRKLRVIFESQALRTIWNGKKAIGVEYLSDGETQKVFAEKGVIVCGGLRSSTFLLHSGVGPKDLLESLDIPVVFDNPNVGDHLADQTLVPLLFLTNPADFPKVNPNSIYSQIAWLPVPGGTVTDPREFQFISVNLVPGFSLGTFQLAQPKSRGRIVIDKADPTSPPVINLGMFSDEADLDLYVQGFQVYIKNITNALKANDPFYQLIFPDPSILDDPNLIRAFIKDIVFSHQCFQSHCLMAPLRNGGVVNSRGFVHGVENLIVADDSIVPVAMDGTPMATAYLIAYNIAQMLVHR